jgi:hypothetical protein
MPRRVRPRNEGIQLARSDAAHLLDELQIASGPTPLPRILEELGLSYEELDADEAAALPRPPPPKVRGILDAEERLVCSIDHSPERHRWVVGHEVGHWVLHKRLLYYCSQADLEPNATKQLEREANEFGAAILFQGRRFTEECLRLPFSLDLLRQRCRTWQVSNEAGFRRFIEQHPGPVALAVCRPIGTPSGALRSRRDRAGIRESGAELRYWVSSRSYHGRGLDLAQGQQFTAGHVIVEAMSSGRSDYYGEVTIGQTKLPMAMFFTSWSALVIIGLPRGESERD